MIGEGWEKEYANDLEAAYKKADEIRERYFKQNEKETQAQNDARNISNFQEDLIKNGLATYNLETKQIDLAEGITIEGLSEKFGMAEDAVISLFGLMESYGANFDWSTILDQSAIDSIVKKGNVQVAKAALDDLTQSTERLKQANEALDKSDPAQLQLWKENKMQIEQNEKAILDMKIAQEQWNDSVVDLQISKLQEYRDQLTKTNDQYQRQKDLQQAIEDLERARTQRTQRVYREGIGFTYEQNQDDIREAQENLEGIVQDQLLDKIDDLIDALEKSKSDTNVYDKNGNLLGQEYTLPEISDWSDLLNSYYSNNTVVSDALNDAKKAAYEQILKGVSAYGANNSFNIGDIIIQGVDNTNEFAEAIKDNFSNAMLQALYGKV